MQIVRAKPEEAAALTEIAHAAKRHWGYPESWIKKWENILTIRPAFIATNLSFSAREGADAVGFYVLTDEEDGLHLDHLWITPHAMGRGLGRALFEHAIEQARSLDYEMLKIEADPNAEGFYLRMGARRVGLSVTTFENHARELPLLEFHLGDKTHPSQKIE